MRNVLTTLLALLILGCQNPNEKLLQENKSLVQKNDSLLESNSDLKKQNVNFKRNIPFLDFTKQNIPQNENDYQERLISTLDFSTEVIMTDILPKSIGEYLVYGTNLKEDKISNTFLNTLSTLINPNRNSTDKFETDGSINDVIKYERYTHSKEHYYYYLWSKLDRSSESLKYQFDKNKHYAYAFLKQENLYKSSGIKNITKALITSYEELNGKKKLLEDLYKRTENIGVLSDTIYETISSEKVNQLLYDFPDWEYVNYSSWVYSFWVRRHNEKNAKTVYELIKEFDNEMSK